MGKQSKEMTVVHGLDLQRYTGRWYEIASIPSFFQPRDGANTRATYSLNPDGTIHVLNETWSKGKRDYIEGSAYKANPNSDEAKFKVKFYVPPFLPIIPVTGNYWVLDLASDYSYALIGEPARRYLWGRLQTLGIGGKKGRPTKQSLLSWVMGSRTSSRNSVYRPRRGGKVSSKRRAVVFSERAMGKSPPKGPSNQLER